MVVLPHKTEWTCLPMLISISLPKCNLFLTLQVFINWIHVYSTRNLLKNSSIQSPDFYLRDTINKWIAIVTYSHHINTLVLRLLSLFYLDIFLIQNTICHHCCFPLMNVSDHTFLTIYKYINLLCSVNILNSTDLNGVTDGNNLCNG